MKQRGFTLIELSIVLVIIGLIVGGVLVGRDLIRAAEVRRYISEVENLRTAINAFRGKYNGLPGDLSTATQIWGAADGATGTGAGCWTATTTATATCNGNNNSLIDGGPESYRAWQQLINSQLYKSGDSVLTGVPASPPYTLYTNDVIGTNIPRSNLNPSAGMVISYGWSWLMGNKPQNTLTIGTCCWSDAVNRKNIEGPAILATDQYMLDTKLDDGLPSSGTIRIYTPYGGANGTVYDVTTPNLRCQAVIGLGF